MVKRKTKRWKSHTELDVATLMTLVKLCCYDTSFSFENAFYTQIQGFPMGGCLSPFFADFMLEFVEETAEKRAVASRIRHPQVFKRYVDDTFVMGRPKSLDQFFQVLNEVHPDIKWTMEEEKDGKLPFLDVCVYRKEDGTISTGVHVKETDTNSYIHYNSYHWESQKIGIISGAKRTKRLSSNESLLRQELDRIRQAFLDDGYPYHKIRRAIARGLEDRPVSPRDDDEKSPPVATLCIPFVDEFSSAMQRIARDCDVQCIFKPGRKLAGEFSSTIPIDPMQRSGVIYKVDCDDCEKSYVGETGRRLCKRIAEHKAAERDGLIKKSCLAQHSVETSHRANFSDVKILTSEKNVALRKAKEAIYIQRTTGAMNIQYGDRPKRVAPPV